MSGFPFENNSFNCHLVQFYTIRSNVRPLNNIWPLDSTTDSGQPTPSFIPCDTNLLSEDYHIQEFLPNGFGCPRKLHVFLNHLNQGSRTQLWSRFFNSVIDNRNVFKHCTHWFLISFIISYFLFCIQFAFSGFICCFLFSLCFGLLDTLQIFKTWFG